MGHTRRGWTLREPYLVVTLASLIGLFTLLPARPALAHHGKDFLLTATDDMPLRGHLYALLSVDELSTQAASGVSRSRRASCSRSMTASHWSHTATSRATTTGAAIGSRRPRSKGATGSAMSATASGGGAARWN